MDSPKAALRSIHVKGLEKEEYKLFKDLEYLGYIIDRPGKRGQACDARKKDLVIRRHCLTTSDSVGR